MNFRQFMICQFMFCLIDGLTILAPIDENVKVVIIFIMLIPMMLVFGELEIESEDL